MKYFPSKETGFTLVEIILVLVIVSAILSLLISYTTQRSDELRRTRTAMQMQMILNAGISYYIANGKWPTNTLKDEPGLINNNHDLIKNHYLPAGPGDNGAWNNGYGNNYYSAEDPTDRATNNFYVLTYPTPGADNTAVNASIIAGLLPFGITKEYKQIPKPPFTGGACEGVSGNYCFIIANVPIPGQNLNNARSINFADVYHSGACVPAPTCPDGMHAEIFVLPVSVSGANVVGGDNTHFYPISSFTAYALPSAPARTTLLKQPVGDPVSVTNIQLAANKCTTGQSDDCKIHAGTGFNNLFWRVCLSVVSQYGLVDNPDQTKSGVMAVTRCVPYSTKTGVTEPSGSNMSIW